MEKTALIWGMNAYPSAPLQGCVNDQADAQAKLAAKGFSGTFLTDGMATDTRMRSELNTIVDNYESGDIIAIVGSCHGSYMADTSGDEVDHRDELICPINFPAGYISDDEIRSILGRLPANAKCYVVLDCCYSGTGTREYGPQTHKIPILGSRYMPYVGKVPKKMKDKAIIVPSLNHCLFAASADNQTSAEILVGGVPRGAFSYYFWKAIGTYPAWTNDQVMAYCKNRLAAIGLSQVPRLECPAGRETQLPFS